MALQDVIDRLSAKVADADSARVVAILRDAQNTLCNQHGLQLGGSMSGMFDGRGKQMTINEVFAKLAQVMPPMRLDAAVLDKLTVLVNNV